MRKTGSGQRTGRQGIMLKGSKKPPTKKEKDAPVFAFQVKKDSTHAVGFGYIRVVLFKEDGMWIAQGLDVDYAAYAPTKQQAKKNFAIGLEGTVDLHIKIHENIENLLKRAPTEVWQKLLGTGTEYRFSQVTFHEDLFKTAEIPYPGILFQEPVGAAA